MYKDKPTDLNKLKENISCGICQKSGEILRDVADNGIAMARKFLKIGGRHSEQILLFNSEFLLLEFPKRSIL